MCQGRGACKRLNECPVRPRAERLVPPPECSPDKEQTGFPPRNLRKQRVGIGNTWAHTCTESRGRQNPSQEEPPDASQREYILPAPKADDYHGGPVSAMGLPCTT